MPVFFCTMKQLLLESRSKNNIEKVALLAAQNPEDFKELIVLMLDEKNVHLASLAAWAMSKAFEKKLSLLRPYYKDLIKLVKITSSDGIKRNITRVWQLADIPDKYNWEIADICYRFLSSPDEAIAVKAFSITVLQQLVKKLPELKNEVVFELEKQLPHSKPAFKYRANAFLKHNEV